MTAACGPEVYSGDRLPAELYGNVFVAEPTANFVRRIVLSDDGTTWRPLTKGLPSAAQGLGRIGIGVAPRDGRRIYAVVEASAREGGIFRSDDGGQTWKNLYQPAYYTAMAGDPANP